MKLILNLFVLSKINYIIGLKSFVLESALCYADAQKNAYEDTDVYPLSLGENKLIEELRKDLIKHYIND
jgi:hypothetical protein